MIELIFGLWLATWRPEYAQLDPSIRQWFQDQRNPQSGVPCCDESDGVQAQEDIRYDAEGKGHYWVTFAMKSENGQDIPISWMQVPDEAVIRQGANPMKNPIVWYVRSSDTTAWIRCYKPGPNA